MTRPRPMRLAAAVAACLVLTGGVAACGGGTTKTSVAAAPTMAAKVRIVGFAFVPMTASIEVGGTVTWVQVDATGHSVQSDNGAWATSAVLMPGQTFSHTFTKAGTYSYICGVHTYMKGTVVVG